MTPNVVGGMFTQKPLCVFINIPSRSLVLLQGVSYFLKELGIIFWINKQKRHSIYSHQWLYFLYEDGINFNEKLLLVK